MLWVSSTRTRSARVWDRADSVCDVGEVGPAGELQAGEPGELDGEHPGGGGWRDGDVDDRQPAGIAGVAAADDQLVDAAELGQRGGLAGAGGAADDHAPAGGDLVPGELDQQAAGGGGFLDPP